MLDLTKIREEFAAHLASDPTRFRMDSALAHVVTLAYRQGIADGQASVTVRAGAATFVHART